MAKVLGSNDRMELMGLILNGITLFLVHYGPTRRLCGCFTWNYVTVINLPALAIGEVLFFKCSLTERFEIGIAIVMTPTIFDIRDCALVSILPAIFELVP